MTEGCRHRALLHATLSLRHKGCKSHLISSRTVSQGKRPPRPPAIAGVAHVVLVALSHDEVARVVRAHVQARYDTLGQPPHPPCISVSPVKSFTLLAVSDTQTNLPTDPANPCAM